MLIRLHKLSLFACLTLAACTSGPAIDALQVAAPSNETTSSVMRPSVGVSVDENATPVRPNALAATPRPAGPAQMQAGRVYGYSFRDAHPINFGSSKPQHLAVHGVDVSRWQGEIDWEKLRRYGANFAYIKATDGGDHLDPKFQENWRAAKRAGLRRGAYHFFYWCRTAASQAEWFIRNVPKEKDALPPVIDVEWNHQSSCKKRPPRSEVLDKMRVFMDRLERHYGQRPVIYTAPDFYKDNLQGAFLNHPFWLRSVAAHPSEVYPGRDWVFWQYSGTGLSSAVKGNIDLNAFRGDESDWWRWVGKVSG
ncbi:MAG: GH25 family lysozyme [Rhizobiaceae bacterium]